MGRKRNVPEYSPAYKVTEDLAKKGIVKLSQINNKNNDDKSFLQRLLENSVQNAGDDKDDVISTTGDQPEVLNYSKENFLQNFFNLSIPTVFINKPSEQNWKYSDVVVKRGGFADMSEICMDFHCGGVARGTLGYLKCINSNNCMGRK